MSEHLSNYTNRTIGSSKAEANYKATEAISFNFFMAAIDIQAVVQDHFPAQEDRTSNPTPPLLSIDSNNLAAFHEGPEPSLNDLRILNSHLEEELRRIDLENIYLRGKNTANVNRIQNLCNNYNALQQEFYQTQLALETTQHQVRDWAAWVGYQAPYDPNEALLSPEAPQTNGETLRNTGTFETLDSSLHGAQ